MKTPLPAGDLHFQFIRATGPGGQNVNKVASAAQLRFDLAGTAALPERVKARLRSLAAPSASRMKGGYQRLYIDHVLQADEGCDFDFLVGCRGAEVPRHSH